MRDPEIIEKLQPWLRRGVKRTDGTQAAPAEAQ